MENVKQEINEYQKLALNFLAKTGTTLTITRGLAKCPTWSNSNEYRSGCPFKNCKGIHGLNYWVTLKRGEKTYSFDFWGSFKDSGFEAYQRGDTFTMRSKAPIEYDILAAISHSIYFEDDFTEFCLEYGYEMKDYELARSTFEAVRKEHREIKRLFPLEEERAQLSEIT